MAERIMSGRDFLNTKFPREDFGNWQLMPNHTLLHKGGYEIDLEECTTQHAVLDWLMHMSQKTWVTRKDLGDLCLAFDRLLRPQRAIKGKINNPKQRIADYLERTV